MPGSKNTAEGIAFILQMGGTKRDGTRAFDVRNQTIGFLKLDMILFGATFETHCNSRNITSIAWQIEGDSILERSLVWQLSSWKVEDISKC